MKGWVFAAAMVLMVSATSCGSGFELHPAGQAYLAAERVDTVQAPAPRTYTETDVKMDPYWEYQGVLGERLYDPAAVWVVTVLDGSEVLTTFEVIGPVHQNGSLYSWMTPPGTIVSLYLPEHQSLLLEESP